MLVIKITCLKPVPILRKNYFDQIVQLSFGSNTYIHILVSIGVTVAVAYYIQSMYYPGKVVEVEDRVP
jgi:hypothetical protein